MKATKKTVKSIQKKPIKTKKIISLKNPVGRPTKYLPVYAKQAKKLAMKGLIDKDIYEILDITEVTGIEWKKKYPEFLKSFNEGKETVNKQVEKKLLEKAMGYEQPNREKLFVVSDGSQIGAHVERVKVTEYYEPDLGAIKYWLNNRKPLLKNPDDGWGDVSKLDVSGSVNYKVIPDDNLED
jgi:hypothetical protein